jgi:hypothetical protein
MFGLVIGVRKKHIHKHGNFDDKTIVFDENINNFKKTSKKKNIIYFPGNRDFLKIINNLRLFIDTTCGICEFLKQKDTERREGFSIILDFIYYGVIGE